MINKRPYTAEFIEATAFICIVSVMCIAWYHGYVKPADQNRQQIMECMSEAGDLSRSGYDKCFQKLIGEGMK